MIILLTPSHQKFVFCFVLFCFSEPSFKFPENKRTHLAILGIIPLLFVALTVIFCLKRDGISFIAMVSTVDVGECMGVLLSQWHLVGRAEDTKSAGQCHREPSYPKC